MKGRHSVYITEPAADDIARSLSYIALELKNPRAAARLLEDLGARIQSLSLQPARYRLLPMSPWRERGYHCVTIRNYIIVYKVDADAVFVARVFHSLQNWEAMLDTLP